jgi:hypothetical protein
MGAVGLTFVIVAAFLGFVIKRGGQLEPGSPGTEAEIVDQDAAPSAATSDAGTVNAALPSSAAPSDGEPDASAADAAPPEPAASASQPPLKKTPSAKGKSKPPRWKPRHR